uniref:Integrase catalytic domain-containing protein n=1 Tax=Tanacetum cinerariifolium TaxID=118510 RepID=A0A699GYU1_TANCI|nr:hypothetical protein [Tanacetum cinerariifolium]
MSAEQVYWLPISDPKSKTPVRIDVPPKLLKVSLVYTSLLKLKRHLAGFDKVVKMCTTPDALTEAGSESHPHMLNKENYVLWSSRLLRYAKSRPNGKLIHNSILNVPYVRKMIPKLGFDIRIQEKKAKLFNEWERFTSNEGESIESYYHRFLKLMNDLKRNKHFPDKIASNLKFLNNLQPERSRHKEVDELKAKRVAKNQDPLALMANSNNPYASPAPHQDLSPLNQNYLQQPMTNPEDIMDPTTAMNLALALIAIAFKLNYTTPTNNNQRISSNPKNRQIAQPRNPAGYSDVIGNQGNGNQNLIGNGNLVVARAQGNTRNVAGQNGNQIRFYNCRGIEEYDFMAAAADLVEIEEVNTNCILMANLQQASTSGTQTDSTPVYDTDGSAEVHENYDDNEIFNMFTQEEQYTELLEPIPESHQVPHNDNDVISEDTHVEQGGETVKQHPTNFKETRALYESLYQNLAVEVEKVNSINRKLKETNADLTTELARYKNQERCFEISQEKYDKLERCYQQFVYQEQCLSKKINALHLNIGKQIMTLNKHISELNKQLSKEKSIVSFLLEEKKKLKSDFKTCEDELLDKQIQLEKKIKKLNNIVLKTGQSIQTIHMLSPKPNSFYPTEQKMALGYQNPFYLKQAQKKQQTLYDRKMLLTKHDPPIVHDSEETLQLPQECRNKMKQMNKEIKPANYTKINHLSGVFVQQMALSREELYFSNISKTSNVSKSISIPNEDLSDDTTPSVARKALEMESKRLLRAVVSQDIISVVQTESVVDTYDLQTELERTKERFENCIIKKENKYAKLWNDWYKKYDECKYDKILYDKAYKDMQQKIERLHAQLGDLKELEFQVFNYARENAHLKATYKTLFDSISVSRTQTQTIIASLQNELQSNIYKNAKLRTQLFKKDSDQKDNTHDLSKNTKFAKQPIVENLSKINETNASSKPVTSNSVSTPQEPKRMNNDKVITLGMFRIDPSKTSTEEKHVPNTVKASTQTKPITVSQPNVITKKNVNSDLNGLSSTGVDNTNTKRPQPRSNTKNDRVPSASKSSRSKNKEAKVEEHHRNLLLSKNNKHISSACNNSKIDSQDVISKKQKAKVSFKETQMKYQPKVKMPKNVGKHESLATPKPRKPRFLLRWSPTGKMFNKTGKIVASSKSESQSDCSNGDNACTSNAMEPKIKRFPNSTSLLDRNDHVAAILGFGDLQWGNILITRVYFLEGLGHNLFSIGQFWDSDLEVAFRRDACFVRNLEGVDINDLVACLPKFKYHKEHLCPLCEQGKGKRASHPPKPVPNLRQRLHLLHMDLCGPMRIASINGKRYILVIVDDYSHYTWVHFLRSKDEAPAVIITFLKRIMVLLQSPVIIIRTDNGTEFKNQVLKVYFDSVGISHQMSYVRTPQQNGVVERRNRTLVEAARTMLFFSRAPLFLWAEAIATVCFTKNHSIIHRRFNKTPYELINGRKLDISFLYIFGALCYPKNDREDIGKLGAKGDIGFFIGYSADSCAYRIYNRRTKKIMETINVSFDELSAMAFEQRSSKPGLQTMYDDYIGGHPSATGRSVLTPQEPQVRQTSMASTTIADIAPIPTNSSSNATNTPITLEDVDEMNPNAMVDGYTFVNPFANPSTSTVASSSLKNVDPSNMHTFYQPYPHEFQWTKDHPLEQVIGEPSRPVLTRNQLRSNGDICMYALAVSTMESKNVKEAMTDPAWIDSMQEELL